MAAPDAATPECIDKDKDKDKDKDISKVKDKAGDALPAFAFAFVSDFADAQRTISARRSSVISAGIGALGPL
jgi:hypothetical protein